MDWQARIERLEKTQRRLKATLVAVVMLAGVGLLLAPVRGNQSEKGKFGEIEAGIVKIMAGSDVAAELRAIAGGAALTLFDPGRKPRLVVALDNTGPKIALFGDDALKGNAGVRASLQVLSTAGPSMIIYGEKDLAFALQTMGGKAGQMLIADSAGKSSVFPPKTE